MSTLLSMDNLQLLSEGATEGAPIETTDAEAAGADVAKTYTEAEMQEQIEATLKKRLAREKAKWETKVKEEREEASELAKLSEAEKQAKLFEKKVKEFEETKLAYENERLLNETSKQLSAKGMPVEFAEILKGADAETTLENINNFEAMFNNALDAAVKGRLKGSTPTVSTSGKAAGFSMDDIKNMSPEEINKNWATISKMQLK